MPDFILNGQAHGSIAATLMEHNFDVGCLRPFIGNDNRSYISIAQSKGGKLVRNAVPTMNATATLRKDEWKLLDEAVLRAAKPRLKVFGMLRSQGLQFTIPNGMGQTVLEHERQSDITPATISMDGLRQGEADRPVYDLQSLPLPIIHKDFHFSARQVMVSRNGSTPLDTTTAELAARRVAEEAEKLTLGTVDTFAYGGGTIYGLSNFPDRLTKVMTHPLDSWWTPELTVQEILAMKQLSHDNYYFGSWMLIVSPNWDQHLDDDYSSAKGDNTLRERIAKVQGINGISTADYLDDYQMFLVQQTSDVIRAVVGMDITTVQWESHGGMQLNYKVMAILVPQLRSDINGNTGIVHGTATLGSSA